MLIGNVHGTSVKKFLQVIIMLNAVIYAINVCIFLAITHLDIVTGNFRKTVHFGIVKIA